MQLRKDDIHASTPDSRPGGDCKPLDYADIDRAPEERLRGIRLAMAPWRRNVGVATPRMTRVWHRFTRPARQAGH